MARKKKKKEQIIEPKPELSEAQKRTFMEELGYIPETPIKGGGGCLDCGGVIEKLSMYGVICVGFGDASLHKDQECVWREKPGMDFDSCMTVLQAEETAAKDPKHDWRIFLIAPLSERRYQRQGPNNWVLYKKGLGFA